MKNHIFTKLKTLVSPKRKTNSFLRCITSGSFLRMSDIRGSSDIASIRGKIEAMRALAEDDQVSTALSYYATDSTTTNSNGDVIWATSDIPEVAEAINSLFKRYKINRYVRDHILEIATVGSLYMPTTDVYREFGSRLTSIGVSLDNNTIPNDEFDIIPSYKIPPEDIIHIWDKGKPVGYIYQPEDDVYNYISYPESAIIHFSLGGLLGDYSIDTRDSDGNESTVDIQFGEPLLKAAVRPTTILNLLEDANTLAALIKVVKFINVDCSDAEEEEIQDILQQVKDSISQQLSIDTTTGDAQSFLNPRSPNNLVYLPKVNGQDAISVTDLNMTDTSEAANKLLEYYQDKKLSVLGIPKEAFNYSSNEGLGQAGTVMSQRSALYANILDRLMNAYKEGWTAAFNAYFKEHNMSGFIDNFELHMNPIVTTQSTIQFDKRDAALNQATTIVQLLKDCGVSNPKVYANAITEILSEVLPKTSADVSKWKIVTNTTDENMGGGMI